MFNVKTGFKTLLLVISIFFVYVQRKNWTAKSVFDPEKVHIFKNVCTKKEVQSEKVLFLKNNAIQSVVATDAWAPVLVIYCPSIKCK